MDFTIVKGWLAFLMLAMAYFAESPSVVVLLPMYAKSSSKAVDYGNGVVCLVVVPRQFDFCCVES